MSITYQCGQCGRWESVRESKVGTIARCKDCGHEAPVPNTPDLFDDQLDGPAGGAAPPRAPGPAAVSWPTTPASPEGGPFARSTASAPPGSPSGGRSWLWVVGVIALIAFRISLRAPGLLNGRGRPPRPNFQAPVPAARPNIGLLNGPIAVPAKFPDLGPAREVEPGVVVREVRLRPEGGRRPAPPGHEMTLWLYLPKGEAGPGSLPCVLIAPAGSITGLSGMRMVEDDRPEHLPYVRAGFAVLAFSLDGPDPGPGPASFLLARAGLVNGRIAREFLKAKVPQVDPGRLYVAGHSSAATFALLFAENEPDLKGCLAYAPVVDLPPFVRAKAGRDPRLFGVMDLVPRFSPRENEAKLACPVFLFAARDDEVIDVREVANLGKRLEGLKKPVTLELVDSGGHIDAMAAEGIPRGVAWLKKRDAEVVAGR